MTKLYQVTGDVFLVAEASITSGLTDPEIKLEEKDKITIIGEPEPDAADPTFSWAKVRVEAGEGFVDANLLQEFKEPQLLADKDLPIEFRRSLKFKDFANVAYRNALLYGSNSGLLIAIAHFATGSEWNTTTAKASDKEGNIGLYQFDKQAWANKIEPIREASGIGPEQIVSGLAQCELVAHITGSHWDRLKKSLGRPNRSIDLLISFLSGVEDASKLLLANNATKLSEAMGDKGTLRFLASLKRIWPDSGITANTNHKKIVDKLSERLDASLTATREIAKNLIKEDVPKVADTVAKSGKQVVPNNGVPKNFKGVEITVTEKDLDALARVSQSEVQIFNKFGKKQLAGGVGAVIDTILNRVAHPKNEFPDTIIKVIDKPKQFSAINNIGTWENLPQATSKIMGITIAHLEARASGASSAIKGATHFLNPNTAGAAAKKQWGNHVVANHIAWYGNKNGKFVHFHGFAPDYKPPEKHALEFRGNRAYFSGEGTPLVVAPAIASTLGSILPDDWKPKADMKRIILHWTGGSYQAGDKRPHYHIYIEGDGNIVRGKFSIKANEKIVKSKYAAHTLNTNTKSIGISVCCMHKAKEKPFKGGKFPFKKVQWEQMVRVVAELCEAYDIEPNSKTVLGHGEVEKNLGIKQKQKWDPMVIPWDLGKSFEQVGDQFRKDVKKLLT